MANVFQLKNSLITADLLSGNIQIIDNDTLQMGQGMDWETFDLAGMAADDATLRSSKLALDQLQTQLALYQGNEFESDPVWAYNNTNGESARRAFVHSFSTKMVSAGRQSFFLGNSGLALLQLALLREPWESTTAEHYTASSLDSFGGTSVLSSTALGSLAGRIERMIVGSSTDQYKKVWIGLRDVGPYGSSGFIARWNCGAAGNLTDAYFDDTDSTAYDGEKINIPFSSYTTLTNRFRLYWQDIQTSGNWSHLAGKYNVLARVKLSSSTTKVYLELKHGFGARDQAGYAWLDATITATLTYWTVVSLGTIQIPPQGNRGGYITDALMKTYYFELAAERLSASGEIDIDSFLLVPLDAYAVIETRGPTTGVTLFGDTAGDIELYTSPDGKVSGQHITGSSYSYNIAAQVGEGWSYPMRGGILVVAGQGYLSSPLNGTLDLEFYQYPRWRSYRG